MPQVPVQPLLPQHCDERRQQRDQETRIHQARRRDDLAPWAPLNGRDGGGLSGNGGLVESEEDGPQERRGLFVRIGLEIRVDIDDKGRADGREQAGLTEQVRPLTR